MGLGQYSDVVTNRKRLDQLCSKFQEGYVIEMVKAQFPYFRHSDIVIAPLHQGLFVQHAGSISEWNPRAITFTPKPRLCSPLLGLACCKYGCAGS